METGSGNSGTTLKNQNLMEEKMIFILGIRKGEGKMREKKRKKTKDIGIQGREKGKMKKKMILTLWATKTRKEKSKGNNINVIFKRISFCFGNLWPQAYTPNHKGSSHDND